MNKDRIEKIEVLTKLAKTLWVKRVEATEARDKRIADWRESHSERDYENVVFYNGQRHAYQNALEEVFDLMLDLVNGK